MKESCQTMTKQSMTGIQSQNNSSFESTGLRVWKAYGVGPEKLITCAQLKRFGTPQWPTGLIMLKPFYEPRQQRSRAITAEHNQKLMTCRIGLPLPFNNKM